MAYQPSFCERGQVQAGHAQVTVRQRTARSRLRLLIAPLLASAICVTGLFGLRGIAHAQSGSVGYVYDSLGRLIAVYDPSGDAAVYNYDAVGNLLSITNDLSTQFTGVGLSSDSGLGGSTLTIYGTDFCASPTVTINGVNATIVSSTSTQIVVTVPSGATSGAVVVTCGSNQITVGTFTVGSNAPSITSFTPTIGSAGAPVTINGSGFQTNPALDAVQFNIPRVYASTATASVITATVPSKATTGHVTVSTPTGQTTSSAYFFVPPPPATVSSIAVTGQVAIGGSPTNVTLTTAGAKALYGFDATAGTQIALSLTNITMPCCYPTATVFNPDGSTLGSVVFNSGNPTTILPDLTLATTGTYSLLIDSSNVTGSLTFQLVNTPDESGTISIGGPAVPLSISIPGQDARLTFSGTAGTPVSLYLTNITIPCCYPTAYILNPDGSTLGSLSFNNTNPGGAAVLADLTLPTTGTYTVYIDPESTNTGNVTVQLYNAADVTGTISIGGPAVPLSISIPGQDARLTFSGTAGTPVSLYLTNITIPCCYPTAYILNPDGSTLGSLSFNNTNPGGAAVLADLTLPTTGTYTVYIDPESTNTGNVTAQLFNASDITGTISIGGPVVPLSISIPGQDARLTFSGTAGTPVSLYLTNITIPCCYPTAYILNPDGSTLGSLGFNNGSDAVLTDITLPTTGTYTVYIDPESTNTGNVTVQLWNLGDISATVSTSDTYATTILGDTPQMYWRLDESGPATAVNAEPAIKYALAGPTSPDTAISLNGYAAYVGTTKQFNSPSTYSVEIWFKTTTTSGGKLIGFGNAATESSSSYDRHIYMTNSGQIIFGQYTGSVAAVTSTGSYNDGFWHYAVGTYNGSTMALYVDGSQVGSVSAGAPQNYSGYWRIGYDNLNGWPSAPNSYYFQGLIGEAAAYSSALSATQVSNHYAAAGGGSYDTTILADSPTSYWKLSESSGPTLADATGGGNTGTAVAGSDNGVYQGGVTYGQPGAISTDNAVTFDGSTGLVQSVFGPPTGSTNASIEAWVYIPGSWTPANGSYSAIIQAGTNNGIGFGIGYNYQGTTGFQLFGLYEYVRWVPVSNPPALTTNTWYHLVMTVDGSGVPTFYINGTSYGEASSGGAPNAPTGSMFVADDPAASGRFFGGTVDEVAAYSYALSATQVSNHYHASGR